MKKNYIDLLYVTLLGIIILLSTSIYEKSLELLLYTIGFSFIFPIFWYIMTYFTADLSGWMRLSKTYTTTKDPPPMAFYTSGKIGPITYSNILKLGAYSEGLWLSVMPGFRINSPVMIIPWSDIQVRPYKSMWFFSMVELMVNGVRIKLLKSKWHRVYALSE